MRSASPPGVSTSLVPPYWAVIFTSLRTPDEPEAYAQTADAMVTLAHAQPGFLGVESARGDDGLGITVSYWESEGAIVAWKANADHTAAREAGRARWYRAYALRVAHVTRAYEWTRGLPG